MSTGNFEILRMVNEFKYIAVRLNFIKNKAGR
jgi:hypothetical protein